MHFLGSYNIFFVKLELKKIELKLRNDAKIILRWKRIKETLRDEKGKSDF